MNVDDGRLYIGAVAVKEAQERGENIVPLDVSSEAEAVRKAERHKRFLQMFPTVKYEDQDQFPAGKAGPVFSKR